MKSLDYIVTGTGRCGTVFAANFLTSAGIPCTHEAFFTPFGLDFALGVLSGEEKAVNSKVSEGYDLCDQENNIRAESSYMSAPFIAEFPKSAVIHFVRNPIRVVSSFLKYGYFQECFATEYGEISPYENFIYRHLPCLEEEMTQLDRACLYWAGWNEIIENSGRVDYRHRLEDSTDGLSKFLGHCGTYSKVSNASVEPGPKWSLAQIQNASVKRKFKDFAKRYNYLSLI